MNRTKKNTQSPEKNRLIWAQAEDCSNLPEKLLVIYERAIKRQKEQVRNKND